MKDRLVMIEGIKDNYGTNMVSWRKKSMGQHHYIKNLKSQLQKAEEVSKAWERQHKCIKEDLGLAKQIIDKKEHQLQTQRDDIFKEIDKFKEILLDIQERATILNRGTDEIKYLKMDLEYINDICNEHLKQKHKGDDANGILDNKM